MGLLLGLLAGITLYGWWVSVPVMAGAKPLYEPMLEYYELHRWEQTSVKS